jgi:hypothetical protein
LETPASLKAAVIEQKVETAYDPHLASNAPYKKRATSLQDTLEKLRVKQNLVPQATRIDNNDEVKLTAEFVTTIAEQQTDDDDAVKLTAAPAVAEQNRWTDDPSEFEDYEYDEFSSEEEEDVPVNIVSMPAPTSSSGSSGMPSMFKEGDPYVVLIRHGRTPHNNLGLFTGWEDPPLASVKLISSIASMWLF